MKNPKGAICAAIDACLREDASVKAAMGGATRYYDRIPSNRLFPYVALGPVTVDFEDETECLSGAETVVQIDVYSREPKADEINAISDAVVEALRRELALVGHDTIDQAVSSARYGDDPDGLSRHAIIFLRFDTEPS